jgi:hypothetical protein
VTELVIVSSYVVIVNSIVPLSTIIACHPPQPFVPTHLEFSPGLKLSSVKIALMITFPEYQGKFQEFRDPIGVDLVA